MLHILVQDDNLPKAHLRQGRHGGDICRFLLVSNICFFIIQFSINFLFISAIFIILAPKIEKHEEFALQRVCRICKNQNNHLKELAGKIDVDPAVLTRALDGNARMTR